ncbi:thioredoxin-like protein AAED1, chloroplastic [Cinnamomum micranthum f. kanehirae]|uniref:Thioredoxin-like protein AAED1, chloroplastic n=1 Tax=Cinnamomum micranthum f. kanehirae TaxID=337451 RepID=A0A3S3N6J2_9MAGN|nr:thioredoxin-like protein AAED1, chloroplastic [Cinnamomum micranthum f. kanehirae]
MAASVRTTPPPWASWPGHRKQDHRPPVSFFPNPNPHDPNITNQRSGCPLRQRGITLSAISGSSGSSSKVISEDPTSLLEGVQVLDLSGKPFPITNLWNDRKAVIAFARHFGCVLCRKRADFLASKKDIMDAAGVALVLIGPGSVEQAKAFSVQTKFQGEIYADPSHSSFKALNFVSGVSTTFTPLAGLKIIQSYMEGYRQDWGLSFQKDTVAKGGWQQGGILVAGPGVSNISYIHKDKEAGDDPDIEDILKACCS